MRRILVLRGGALGDFIVTLPALLALRRKWPDATIELIGNATAAELARRRGLIDQVYSQHEARWGALEELRNADCGVRIGEETEHRTHLVPHKENAARPPHASAAVPADSAIRNPHSAIGRSSLRPWLSSFDLVVNYWPDPEGTLARGLPTRPDQRFVSAAAMPAIAPAAAHYAGALGELGVFAESYFCLIGADSISFPEGAGLDAGHDLATPPTPTTAGANPNRRGRETPPYIIPNGPIAIHPGSGSLKKNWPIERWREVIAQLGAPVLMILGEAELERWGPMPPSGFGSNVRVLSNLPVEELIVELRSCRLFLGHDSGVSHLAAACGVPSVLLFGPTDPAMWAPPAPYVTVMRRGEDISAIGVDEVLAAAGAMARSVAQ